MSVCARAVQQPDGTLVLALAPTVTDLSTCPYLVEDGASNAWRELGNMSIENAHQIGMTFGLCLAVVWGFKIIRKSISINPESD
jgi:hypothetical protein